ncbi:SdrD B-like domain-containing protein [Aporhodopirellula aestuarii]|uniref:DUF4347 domain-containing protein n=1 Tax=Aporhodopirellula aestuarii TaxID=2950107 RepID=A0ABT0U7W1_9BACT|nr:SdrD B-like domain-containing protein [Aporhodopirellula aestuarii]MCM2372640.1 DUF4347 domain-containing protein [Aporhodopirellula aestuarii]
MKRCFAKSLRLFQTLEERVLFDAAVATEPPAESQTPDQAEQADSATMVNDESALDEAAAENLQLVEKRRELVIVDPAVESYQELIDDLINRSEEDRTLEVILLQGDASGFDQVSELLASRQDLDAIHVVSHGEQGAFRLGNDWVDSQSLYVNSGSVAAWGDALTTDADILLYGCDIAGSEQGIELVEQLASLTDANVAASDDDTGASQQDADWELEHHHGSVETEIAFSESAQSSYSHRLAAGPQVTLPNATRDVQLGSTFNFDVTFENTGSDVGYGPVVDLLFPAAGIDGYDGVSFGSASYLGTVVNSTVSTFANDSNGFGVVEHPYFEIVQNETQAITIDSATTGGTFTLGFGGQTTTDLAFNADAATVQAALEALSSVSPGDVSVTGGMSDGYVLVEFIGTQAQTDVSDITVNNASLVGGTAAALTVNDGSATATRQRLFGRAGDQLVTLELPFGSFAPGQPAATVNVTATLSEFADLGEALTIGARSGFRFGEDPVDNPDADAVLLSDNEVDVSGASAGSQWSETMAVNPTLISLTKSYSGAENEMATGPSYESQYVIRVDIADGQTISDLDVIDSLPDNIVVTSIDSVTVGGSNAAYTDNLGSLTTPGTSQDLIVSLDNDVTGTSSSSDVVVTFSFYVSEFDGNSDRVIPVNGEDDTTSTPDSRSFNNARAEGTWTPTDGLDAPAVAMADPTGPEHTLDNKAIAIQKTVAVVNDVGSPGATPGDVLEYTLEFQISDYFTFGDLQITDLFQDGQLFDFGYGATFDITDLNGSVTGSFTVREVIDPDGGETLVVDQTQIDRSDDTSESGTSDGSTTLTFDLSQVLVNNGAADGILQGGLSDGPTNQGAATGTIRFRTVIQDEYADTFPSGDRSVDQGDVITNSSLTISGTVRENAEDDDLADGFASMERVLHTESDTSSASIQIQGGTLAKTVYAINGSTTLPTNPDTGKVILVAGDVVTYRINYSLSSTDFENLVLTDYLPLPIFDVTDHDADGFDNAGATYGWTVDIGNSFDTTPPGSGVIEFGANDSFFYSNGTNSNITPNILIDPVSNSLALEFGNYDDPSSPATEIELYLSVTASDLPTADGLFLTNQVRASEGTTQQDSTVLDEIIQVEMTQPLLAIQKGVVDTDSTDANITGSVGPVTFASVGSGGTFTGTLHSDGLEATPVDANIDNLEAGDRVRYAIVIENFGSSYRGAHDVTLQDQLPDGFTFVGGSMRIVDGTGADHTFTDVNGGNPGLFGDGIIIDDPGPTPGSSGIDAGAIDGDDPTNGRNILVILYDVELTDAATINQTHTNTAEITHYASKEGGQNHAAGLTETADATTSNFDGTKTIVSTDQAHTTFESGAERVTVGETIRYRIQVEIPQGSLDDFVVRDLLPNGLTFMDDGMANVAFISDGGLSSDTISGVGLDSTNPAYTPTFALPDTAVSISASGQDDTYATGTDVYFKLGNLTNSDTDANAEYVVIEFNALVDNSVSGSNDSGDGRYNDFRVQSGDTTEFDLPDGSRPLVQIVEPLISQPSITSSIANVDAGDAVEYTVDFAVTSGTNQSDAFDVVFDATLPDNFTFDSLNSIRIDGVVVNFGDADYPTISQSGSSLTVTFDRLNEGQTVEIVYDGAVDGTVTPDDTLTTASTLTWTSLATDSGSGTTNGERDGSNTTGVPNDYYQAASQDVDVATTWNITKTLVGTEIVSGGNGANQGVIGELVTYRLVIDFPEATVPQSIITDQLDAGLAFVNVLSTSDSGITFSGSLTPAITNNGQTITFDLGTVTDSDTSDGNGGQLTIEYQAVVLNTSGNQTTTALDNVATYTWGNNSDNNVTNDAADVIVVEPEITLDQSISIAGNAGQTTGDAGDAIQYTIEITNGSGLDAFELGFLDDLPTNGSASVLTGVTFSVTDTEGLVSNSDFTLSGSDGTGYSLEYTGTDWDMLASQVGRTITITVDGTIASTVTPNASFENNPEVDWSSLNGTVLDRSPHNTASDERVGTDSSDNTADYISGDALSFVVNPPGFVKSLVSTNQTETTGSNVTIGEEITYRLSVTMPEGESPDLTLVDQLPDGLQYVSFTLDTAGFNGTVGAPTVTGGTSDGEDVTFAFGAISTAVDNNGSNNSFSILVTAVVTDNPGTTGYTGSQSVLSNVATIDLSGDAVAPASSNSVDVTVVESNLGILKSIDLADVNARDEVTVTIEVENDGPHAAYEVNLQDVLDPTVYDISTVSFTTTESGFTEANSSGTITYSGGDITSGATATFEFTVRVHDDVVVGQDYTNTARITSATTLDGTETGERDQTDADGDSSDVDTDSIHAREHTLDGFVYFDADNDGVFDGSETGIDGVTVTLTGTDHLGRAITPRVFTTGSGANPDGFYLFEDLRPGTYSITQTQPTTAPNGKAYMDGTDTIGTGGGDDSANDTFTTIVLSTANENGGADYNFGELEEGELSGIVYHDANNNGVFDAGDSGIDGVTVTLTGTDDNGVITPIVLVTSGGGLYAFDELRPGEYTITETQPAFNAPSGRAYADRAETDGSLANGALSINDQIHSINVAAGDTGTEYRFGEVIESVISGYVFTDQNNDSDRSDGIGISGQSVRITGTDDVGNTVDQTVSTDGNGFYQFAGLRPSDATGYTITQVSQPTGYLDGIDTVGSQGGTLGNDQFTAVVINSDTDGSENNFAELRPNSLEGYVFNDRDNDGEIDTGEGGIALATLRLTGTDDRGNDVDITVQTDSNGRYEFINLRPSDATGYTITETQPPEWNDGQHVDGSLSNGDDSVANVISGIDVVENAAGIDYNFGERGASISGTVFFDDDRNGTQQAGETTGINNIRVELYDSAGTNLLEFTTTDSAGDYRFDHLAAGDYVVRQIQPRYYTSTSADELNVTLPVTGLTEQDFGETQFEIGGVVYWDADNDGTNDIGTETGLSGVTVTLQMDHDGDGNFEEDFVTTTDANGNYLFTEKPGVDYRVVVTPLAGTTQTDDPDATLDDQATFVVGLANLPTDQDFGYRGNSSIGDLVFFDYSGDGGAFDAGDNDRGFAGVDITLEIDVNGDTSVDYTQTVTTAANGSYLFDHLIAGDYTITVDSSDLPDQVGNNPTYNSDATIDDATIIVLPVDTDNSTTDFGYHGHPDYTITVVDGNENVVAGQSVTHDITLVNNGTFHGQNVVVVAEYPTNVLENVTATNGGVIDASAGTVTWTLPVVQDGETVNLSITGDVVDVLDAENDPLTVDVSVSDDAFNGVDLTTLNNQDSDTDQISNLQSLMNVLDVSANGDLWDVTFEISIENTGSVRLDELTLLDDIEAQLGSRFVSVTTPVVVSTGAGTPTINSGWSSDTSLDLFDPVVTNEFLDVGESLTVTFVATIDPDASGTSAAIDNTAIAGGTDVTTVPGTPLQVTDVSDGGSDVAGTNPGAPGDLGTEDDPTQVYIADLGVATHQSSAVQDPATRDYTVTYTLFIENTGSVTLDQLSILDDVVTQFGDAFVEIEAGTLAIQNTSGTGTLPSVNPGWETDTTQSLIDGASASLDAGDSFEITFNVVVDPDAVDGLSQTAENQASASGRALDEYGDALLNGGSPVTATDLSDSGTDANSSNAGFDGDTGSTDDATPLVLPEIGAAKRLVSSTGAPDGNRDLTYEIVIRNLGTVPLDNITLTEDLDDRFGPGFISVVSPPAIVASTADQDPNLAAWNGDSLVEIFDGASGTLDPGDQVVVRFTVRIDIDQLDSTSNNQVEVSGDYDSRPMIAGYDGTVTDLSDTGSDPASSNPGNPGDSGGFDDPTLVPAIGVALDHGDPTPVPGTDNFTVPVTIVVENLGATDLNNLQLSQDLAATFGDVFLSVSNTQIPIAGVTGTPPTLNPNWESDVSQNMLDPTTGILRPGDVFVVTFDMQVDPDAGGTSAFLNNQAVVTGADPSNATAVVNDRSDSGQDPSTTNPGQPGDSSTADDPTPLHIPDIGIAKSIIEARQRGLTYDLTIQFIVENTGTVDLTDLQLFDNLATEYGVNFGRVVGSPQIVLSNATVAPVINHAYDNDTTQNIFDGSTGLVRPGESLTVQMTVEVVSQPGQTEATLTNQAQAVGNPLDENGAPLRNQSGGLVGPISDLSDSGVDANGINAGEPGDEETSDDPTTIDLTFFTFDAYNDFSQNEKGQLQDSKRDSSKPFGETADGGFYHRHANQPRVLSQNIHTLAPDPIFSGAARPGTQIIGRIYDGAGRLLGEEISLTDVGGNWMMQFHQTNPEQHVRIEFVELPGQAGSFEGNGGDGFGYLGIDRFDNEYASLEPWTSFDQGSEFVATLRPSARNSLMQAHRHSTRPLGLGNH